MPLAAGVLAAVAVLVATYPGPRPRRFPEDDDRPARRSPRATLARRRGRWRWPSWWRWRGSDGDPHRRRRAGGAVSPTGATSSRTTGDLASCCDLLAVASVAGCTVTQSLGAVGAMGGGPVAAALSEAAADVVRGSSLSDALDVLQRDLGPAGQPLATTLRVGATSGAPLGPALVRLADVERRRSRRMVEARVRRLPVLLLLPLAGLVLPAFVLVTLVPVAMSAARGAGLVGAVTPPTVAALAPRPGP